MNGFYKRLAYLIILLTARKAYPKGGYKKIHLLYTEFHFLIEAYCWAHLLSYDGDFGII